MNALRLDHQARAVEAFDIAGDERGNPPLTFTMGGVRYHIAFFLRGIDPVYVPTGWRLRVIECDTLDARKGDEELYATCEATAQKRAGLIEIDRRAFWEETRRGFMSRARYARILYAEPIA